MTPATLLLVLVLFVVALALVFVVGKALSSWVFELTPRSWLATVILAFSLGALLVAYIVGDGTLILLSAAPVAIAFVWWIVSAWSKRSSAGSSAAAED